MGEPAARLVPDLVHWRPSPTWADLHRTGPTTSGATVTCGCHPNCGIGTVLFVNKRTKQMVPLLDFLDVEGLLADLQTIFDAGSPKTLTLAKLTTSLLRRYRADKAPPGFDITTFIRQYLSQTGAMHREGDANEYEWRVLFVAGMWFQDLWNYDFRRTEMCIIPYGTQLGEISFCAYNTGTGFRQVVENMKRTASLAEWYEKNGRHPVHAKNKDLPLPALEGPLTVVEHDLAKRERSRKVRRLPIVG
jgi:uncharacterized radical SAM superfamily Fe-S cluster-containing enzyme